MRIKSPPSSPLLIIFLLLAYRDDHHVDAFHLHLKSGKISPFSLVSFYVPKASYRTQISSQFSVCSINDQKQRNQAGVFLADISIKVSQENQRDVRHSGAENKNMLLLERSDTLELLLAQTITLVSSMALAKAVAADDTENSSELPRVLLSVPKEIKQIYNDGLAKQIQGNILAANRIFAQVTKLAPEFVYGWSNLGNTQVALGSLREAEDSYTKSIELCKIQEQKKQDNVDNGIFGSKSCDNLYVLYLNRGTTRLALNTTTKIRQQALEDLEEAAKLRGQPDVLVFQNRARGRELNGFYTLADSDYDVAISMSKDGVAPYWLRAALVKFQLNRYTEALSLTRRVEQRFPEAPEVRATLAALYSAMGDTDSAQRKFLEIPEPTRLLYSDSSYLTQTIVWPPNPLYYIMQLAKAVGDAK